MALWGLTDPVGPLQGELLHSLHSHLADVVVDCVCIHLAHRVTRQIERAVFVCVHLRHWHIDRVGVFVRSLRPIGRRRLQMKCKNMLASYCSKISMLNQQTSYDQLAPALSFIANLD